ncbi:MAG: O-methyltransferase [Erysipelotrichaceae bacterium]|nr:O-methyltransferase [Erysipelotrichaceae bacterium]
MKNEELLEEMYSYALRNDVPIMESDGLNYLQFYFQQHGITSLLEIGTAIGYSAIAIASENPQLKRILTLEIDPERCEIARKYIERAGMSEIIEVVNCDCRSYKTEEMFDAVLLDGPKAHNQQLFERFEKNINPKGHIIVDDVYFHGFIDNQQVIRTRRMRQMVQKLQKFRDDLMNNPGYQVTYLKIGDGILTGEKRGD